MEVSLIFKIRCSRDSGFCSLPDLNTVEGMNRHSGKPGGASDGAVLDCSIYL